MTTLKLTPLLLFLIILIVLILSTVIGNYLPLSEGFVSFSETTPVLNTVIIPQYSLTRHMYKMHDSLYFDELNGNVVQVYGKQYDPTTSNLDVSGASISFISVMPRSGNAIYNYNSQLVNGTIQPSTDSTAMTTSVSSQYNSWMYPSSTTYTNQPYQIIYMPWNDSTFVHIYDIDNKKMVSTFMFGQGSIREKYEYNTVTLPEGFTGSDGSNINKYLSDSNYDATHSNDVYTLSDYVKFDTKNGNLIIQKGSGDARKLDVYQGTTGSGSPVKIFSDVSVSGTIKDTPSSILANRPFTPFLVLDETGKNMVLYMQNANKTMVALLSRDSANSKLFTLRNCVRFNPGVSGGIDKANTTSEPSTPTATTATSTTAAATATTTAVDIPTLDNIISDYYKKYWYQNAQITGENQYSDDFLLKTQMIPPVCPACPSCPSKTTCTNCGGQGGSGTVNGEGKSIIGYDISGNAIYSHIHSNGIADNTGNVVSNTVGTAGYVAGKTLDTAGKLVGGTIGTAGYVAGKTLDAAGNVVGTAGGLLYGAGSGLKQMIEGAGSGYGSGYGSGQGSSYGSSYGSGSGTGSVSNNQRNTMGPDIQPVQSPPIFGSKEYIDKYSYNGALSSKGGDPMPVTADFSAFAR